LGIKYVENPVTFGQKLLNRRLELRLLQKDVAEIIGVDEASIGGWELDKGKPTVRFYPKLALFLGYLPYEGETETLRGKLRFYQHLKGLTQEELAKQLGVDESTVCQYGTGRHRPSAKVMKKLEPMFREVGEEIRKRK
jgi:transcriptional regulator with XRE-family HTH domain